MVLNITHTFVNPIADDPAFPGTKPSDWNAAHTITGTIPAANVGAAGSNTQVQFNNAGALGADSGFIYSVNKIGVGSSAVIASNATISSKANIYVGAAVTTNAGWSTALDIIQFGNSGAIWGNNNGATQSFFTNNAVFVPAATYMGNGYAQGITFDTLGNILLNTAPNNVSGGGAGLTLTTQLFVANNGNIGIGNGSTAPSAKTQITSTTEQLRLGYDASNYVSNTLGSTGSYTITVNGSAPYFNFTGGNFGIGVASPNEKLHVNGAICSIGGATTNVPNSATLDFTSNAARFISRGSGGPGDFRFFVQNGSGGGTANFFTFIGSTAFAGIGTASPTNAFQILATAEQLRLSYDASNYEQNVVSSTGVVTRTANGTASAFNFNVTGSATQNVASFLQSSLSTGNLNAIQVGQSSTTNNAVGLVFKYVGAGSASNLGYFSVNGSTGLGVYSNGGSTIGSSYTAIITPPANGLAVQGNILNGTLVGTGNRNVYANSTGVLTPTAGFAESTLFVATASTTVANTTTQTSIIPTGVGSMTIAANQFTVGKSMILKGRGIYSDTITAPNLVVTVKLGSTVLATGTVTALLGSATNNGFSFEMLFTCRTVGTSGTLQVDGSFPFQSSTAMGIAALYLNNAGSPVTINTTTAQLLDVQITWSAAAAGNTITCNQVTLQSLGE